MLNVLKSVHAGERAGRAEAAGGVYESLGSGRRSRHRADTDTDIDIDIDTAGNRGFRRSAAADRARGVDNGTAACLRRETVGVQQRRRRTIIKHVTHSLYTSPFTAADFHVDENLTSSHSNESDRPHRRRRRRTCLLYTSDAADE